MKYTVPNKLGILGGSNGGLLVSVVSVQRPDLFAATCAAVPLTDMVRFQDLEWLPFVGFMNMVIQRIRKI